VDDYADFVVEFLHQFKRKKVILLGHSYGGRVIIKLSARKNLPFAIVKNILVDAAGIMPHRSLAYKLRVRLYKLGKAVLNFPLMTKLFPDDYAAASPVMRGSLVKAVNEDLEPLLPQITAETLLIWGDKDTATPLSDGRKMEKQIKGSGLVVFSGAGHYSFLEQPYLFAKVIKSFLNIGD
jgi:pimeloyl-ACP methyl ester carboxylesterase